MKDRTRRLRPMGIADILDETVELYKTSFVLLVGIAALLYVPYSIFNQYFTMKYLTQFDPTKPPSLDSLLPLFGGLALSIIWLIVASPFVTGAMTFAISERYLGHRTTIMASFKRVMNIAVFPRIAGAVSITLLTAVIAWGIIAGLVLVCVLAGTWNTYSLFAAVPLAILFGVGAAFGAGYVLLRLALLNCVIVVELDRFISSVSRSWSIMKGSMLKCLALLLLTWAVVWIVSYLVMQPTQSVISMNMLKGGHPSDLILLAHALISAVVSTVLAPVTSIVVILVYYDIRIRKEGLDLELLASELNATSRQPTVWVPQALPQEQVTTQPQQEQAPTEETEESPGP